MPNPLTELFVLIVAVLFLGAIPIGYASNIVEFIGHTPGGFTAPEIARAAGIAIPPLGIVEGFIDFPQEKVQPKQ